MYSCGRMLYALAKNRQLPGRWRKFPVTAYQLRVWQYLLYSANWLMPELHHSQSAACVCYVYSASVLPGMVPWFVILITSCVFGVHIKRRLPAIRSAQPVPVGQLRNNGIPDLRFDRQYFNEDTRMSLFVGIIFMLAGRRFIKFLALIATGKRINWRISSKTHKP